MQSTVRLRDGMQFDATIGTHTMIIDAKAEHGGADGGPPPKELMLSALAGCAAMDVISLLRKMRATPETLEVRATAELTSDHPKVFDTLRVDVVATGGISTSKLWKAVALSRDRYCGVATMLRAHRPIRYFVELDGENIPEP